MPKQDDAMTSSHAPDSLTTVTSSLSPADGVGDARAPAGYVIERELGRGGMAVVYLARSQALQRSCALKMLAGVHTSESDLERFRTEAQAIARLQHPGIVQIFETGVHEGRPFIALEFCPGGSLDAVLGRNPLPPREAAKLVRSLAFAMHAAHLAQVIHRDLKPGNILLSNVGSDSGEWVPKVTDFGLAKKLDEQGLTQTGSILGTPSYMAPEQAVGKKDVGPLVDVYSLGAILYECLTGRPPFRAATAYDTILQVVNQDPVPVRQLNALVPGDLETIALKCLEKDSTRRYSSMKALGDDLERYLAGEPIEARPVGMWGRGSKWVRRNPVVSSLGTLVFLALAVGISVSTWFALDARQKASELEQERNTAQANATRATNNERATAQALAQVELTLARSLLRPLAVRGEAPMSRPEWEALWELSMRRPGRLGYHFVEEATRKSMTTRQLSDRASLALHAATGLDPNAQVEIEGVLLRRIGEDKLGLGQQVDLFSTITKLDGLSPAGARQTGQLWVQALTRRSESEELHQLVKVLPAVVGRLDKREGQAIANQAAEVILRAMQQSQSAFSLGRLAESLTIAAAHMDRPAAAQVSSRAAQRLLPMLETSGTESERRELAHWLWAVLRSADEKTAQRTAAQATRHLVRVLQRTKDAHSRSYLGEILGSLATQMEPEAAVAFLTQTMKDTRDDAILGLLAPRLASPARRLPPRKAAAVLLQAMETHANSYSLPTLAAPLPQVLERLPDQEAATSASKAATLLAQALKPGPQRRGDAESLMRSLAAVVPYMEGTKALPLLTQALKTSQSHYASTSLIRGLSAVASRVGPSEARQAVAELNQTIQATTSSEELVALVEGVGILAPRMEPREALTVLSRAMEDPRQAVQLWPLARGFTQTTRRLEASQAVAALTLAMKSPKLEPVQDILAEGLAEAATRLEARVAARLLLDALQEHKSVVTQVALARGLASVVRGLDGPEATKHLTQAATLFTQAMRQPRTANYLELHAQGLAAVSAGCDSSMASQTADSLLSQMGKTREWWSLYCQTQELAVLLPRMDPRDASRVAEQASAVHLKIMKESSPDSSWVSLSRTLAAISDRLEPATVYQAAALLLHQASDRHQTFQPEYLVPLEALLVEPLIQGQGAATALVGQGYPLNGLSLVAAATRPRPCRLTTQQLVDLLKMPTCAPEARRLILDLLGHRHQRRFSDVFDFVRFANDRNLGLDFASPPRRPDID